MKLGDHEEPQPQNFVNDNMNDFVLNQQVQIQMQQLQQRNEELEMKNQFMKQQIIDKNKENDVLMGKLLSDQVA